MTDPLGYHRRTLRDESHSDNGCTVQHDTVEVAASVRFMELLGKPAWQGVGAIVAITALVAYLWFEVRRRNRREASESSLISPESPALALLAASGATDEQSLVTHIAIIDAESERRFYDELICAVRGARETFYRSGHGFQRESQAGLYRELLRAEGEALGRGVEMVRIQTGARVAATWADGCADLLERFPHQLRVVTDFESVLFNDIGLIDPHGHDPIIYLLFETRETASVGMRTRPATVIFIRNARWLANILGQQFASRIQALTILSPQDVRDLAKSYVYFGWGVHIASRKMLRDVPDAHRLGTAILRGWRRDISAMLAGPANRATIHRTSDEADAFDGVAYELSWWGKTRLDRLERRAYRTVPVIVEIDGRQREAFTYVPLPSSTVERALAPGSWIDFVIEGAHEHGMLGLIDELRAAGAPVYTPSSDTL
jgi:hypothetical protein